MATATSAVIVSCGEVTVRVSEDVVDDSEVGALGAVFEDPVEGVVETVAVSPCEGSVGAITVAARSVTPDPVSHMRPVESVAIPSEIVIATWSLFVIVKTPLL
jgi:hypothetical protein